MSLLFRNAYEPVRDVDYGEDEPDGNQISLHVRES